MDQLALFVSEAVAQAEVHPGMTLASISGVDGTLLARFPQLRLWTLSNRDFICVEPWDGPADVINSNQARLVSPGETVTYWMQISTERQAD